MIYYVTLELKINLLNSSLEYNVMEVCVKYFVLVIMSHDESTPLFLTVAHNAPHSGNAASLLQAPAKDVRAMRHVESPQRRIFAGKLMWYVYIVGLYMFSFSDII